MPDQPCLECGGTCAQSSLRICSGNGRRPKVRSGSGAPRTVLANRTGSTVSALVAHGAPLGHSHIQSRMHVCMGTCFAAEMAPATALSGTTAAARTFGATLRARRRAMAHGLRSMRGVTGRHCPCIVDGGAWGMAPRQLAGGRRRAARAGVAPRAHAATVSHDRWALMHGKTVLASRP